MYNAKKKTAFTAIELLLGLLSLFVYLKSAYSLQEEGKK